MIFAVTFLEACVNFKKVAYPKAFTLRPTTVNRVTFCWIYDSSYAAFKMFWMVKENAAEVTDADG